MKSDGQKDCARESRESVLSVHLDDDNHDDLSSYQYVCVYKQNNKANFRKRSFPLYKIIDTIYVTINIIGKK